MMALVGDRMTFCTAYYVIYNIGLEFQREVCESAMPCRVPTSSTR